MMMACFIFKYSRGQRPKNFIFFFRGINGGVMTAGCFLAVDDSINYATDGTVVLRTAQSKPLSLSIRLSKRADNRNQKPKEEEEEKREDGRDFPFGMEKYFARPRATSRLRMILWNGIKESKKTKTKGNVNESFDPATRLPSIVERRNPPARWHVSARPPSYVCVSVSGKIIESHRNSFNVRLRLSTESDRQRPRQLRKEKRKR